MCVVSSSHRTLAHAVFLPTTLMSYSVFAYLISVPSLNVHMVYCQTTMSVFLVALVTLADICVLIDCSPYMRSALE